MKALTLPVTTSVKNISGLTGAQIWDSAKTFKAVIEGEITLITLRFCRPSVQTEKGDNVFMQVSHSEIFKILESASRLFAWEPSENGDYQYTEIVRI